MEREKLISIIMAAYNAEKTIGAAIESVISQTYKNWELLVINDSSTDNTSIVVNSFNDSRIQLINNHTNLGVSKTRQVGLNLAKGKWIAILDSDDMWAPEKLEKQMDVLSRNDAVLVYTGSSFIDASGNPLEWILRVPSTISYHVLLKQNLISNSSVLIEKEIYKSHYVCGDEMHEDFAVWLSILKDGNQALGIDEPLLIYRLAKSSKTGNKLKAARMNWNTYRYIGLNLYESSYYMIHYTVRNLRKYSHLQAAIK